MPVQRYTPLLQLTLARFREFYREPAAVFWVYVFPLLLAIALGIAFREKPVEKITVDIRVDVGSPKQSRRSRRSWPRTNGSPFATPLASNATRQLGSGKTDLVIAPVAGGGFELWDEPNRPGSVLARHAVESVLYRPASGGTRLDAEASRRNGQSLHRLS